MKSSPCHVRHRALAVVILLAVVLALVPGGVRMGASPASPEDWHTEVVDSGYGWDWGAYNSLSLVLSCANARHGQHQKPNPSEPIRPQASAFQTM